MPSMSLRELRDHLGATVREVCHTGHEVLITDNGKLVGVLIAPDDYERLHEHADVADGLALRELRAQPTILMTLPEMLDALDVSAEEFLGQAA